MSESDTMFKEWDRRCATAQLMLSTNPSYNRTIASTLKMQIWIAMNNRDVLRVMKKFLATVMVFGVVSSEGHIMPPHVFKVGLKVNTKVYLDVLNSVVIRWCNQVADPGCGSKTRCQPTSLKRPRLGFRSATTLYSSLTGPPPPPTWTHWTTSFGHTPRTSPTWLPITPKPVWSLPSAEFPPALVEKACSQFRIRIKAVIEAEGGFIE